MNNTALFTNEQLEGVLSAASTGLWRIEVDNNGTLPRMYANSAMCVLLGIVDLELTPEEIYNHWFDNIESSYVDTVNKCVAEIVNTGQAEVVYPWIHPELGEIFVRCGGVPNSIYLNGICLQGYHQNITNTYVTIKENEELASLIRAIGKEYYSIYFVNLEKDCVNVVYDNQILLNTSRNEALLPFNTWVNNFLEKSVYAEDTHLMKNFFNLQNIRKSLIKDKVMSELFRENTGDHFTYTEAKIIPVKFNDNKLVQFAIMAKDVNEVVLRERSNKALLEEALNRANVVSKILSSVSKDTLTGLYDKEYFLHTIKDILNANTNTEYYIIYVDIDKFKLVNDAYGTLQGDQLLIYLANEIRMLEKNGAICSRITGDEFAILTSNKTGFTLDDLVRIQNQIDNYPLDIKINLRFGIYKIDDSDIEVSLMCDRCKLACDSIKGKYNELYAFYDDKIRNRLLEEQFIIDNMQKALLNKQFQVYYQPIYSAKTKEIVSAEALVRWFHPIKGMLSPMQFISIFESNGFITKLDRYVLERVCEDIECCRKENINYVPVSINFSKIDFYVSNIYDDINSILDHYHVDKKDIHIEITESAYTSDFDNMMKTVNQFRSAGFNIWMDDFGSGYSSLNVLKDINIDTLKIDMRFFENFEKSSKARTIVSAIIKMAKSLDLTVVAEGIETEGGVMILDEFGCDMLQGYYFAKPTDFETFKIEFLSTIPPRIA